MSNMNEVIINDIVINKDEIIINFDGSERIEAWLENKNKHYPDIFYINVDNDNKRIVIEYRNLYGFIKRFPGQVFKLSLCTTFRRISYKVPEKIGGQCFNSISIAIEGSILFSETNSVPQNVVLTESCINLQHKNKLFFENIEELPIETLNIGTCFSRSIFKSDEYFNPTYKKYFNVSRTIFHNSFISIFSDEIKYDYSKIEDLVIGDAGKYVGIEFKKDIATIFRDNAFRLVVADNYIDATTPIIKYDNNSYLTYNKYLSESIFKRFFSSCEIIYPGTQKHLELYKKSIMNFRKTIDSYNIKNVVLIGGRLSKFKIDEELHQTSAWSDKTGWITNTNENWDKADKIFLEEIPDTIYIDKRKTLWKSDIHSPIIGGASPSHYQSGYYKELFENILQFLREDLFNEN